MSDETHPCQTCSDEHCPLPYCRIWKEAYEVGYADGYSLGYGCGYADGYSAGAAAGGDE